MLTSALLCHYLWFCIASEPRCASWEHFGSLVMQIQGPKHPNPWRLSRQTGYCPQLIVANVLGKPSNSDLSDLTVAKVEIVV